MWKKYRNMACMGIVGAVLFGVGDWLIYLYETQDQGKGPRREARFPRHQEDRHGDTHHRGRWENLQEAQKGMGEPSVQH